VGLLLLRVFNYLPHRIKVMLCRCLGKIGYRIAVRRRQIALTNLKLCFPDMEEAERHTLVKRNFEEWSISLVEIAMSWYGAPKGFFDDLVVEGIEHFEEAEALNRGVILLGAHFSTIELGSLLFRLSAGNDLPVHVVYREQKNELFNHVMKTRRLRHATSIIAKSNLRQIIRRLRAKEIIWYAPDHDLGEQNSVFVPFFGQTAATLTTTSQLASINHAPVIMMSHYRNPDQRSYTVKFAPALEDFPSGDNTQDALQINRAIESAIREVPEQYMWIHRRFKTQPGMEKGALYLKP